MCPHTTIYMSSYYYIDVHLITAWHSCCLQLGRRPPLTHLNLGENDIRYIFLWIYGLIRVTVTELCRDLIQSFVLYSWRKVIRVGMYVCETFTYHIGLKLYISYVYVSYRAKIICKLRTYMRKARWWMWWARNVWSINKGIGRGYTSYKEPRSTHR